MNQLKFYKYTTWALLFLNIGILAFFLLTKPKPPHLSASRDFQSEVIEILHLNSQQVTTFKDLATAHNQKMKSINEQQQKLLPPYFERLIERSQSIDEDVILNEFQQLEREKIVVTYRHFQDLKSILDKNQLPQFDKLMGRFVDKLLLSKKDSPPPPKNFK